MVRERKAERRAEKNFFELAANERSESAFGSLAADAVEHRTGG